MVSSALDLWVRDAFGHPSEEGIFLGFGDNLFGLGVGELDMSGEEE
jgi:hypothetical protein